MRKVIYLPLFLWLLSSASCSRRVHRATQYDASLEKRQQLEAQVNDSSSLSCARQIVVENPCLIVRRIRGGDTLTVYAVADRLVATDSISTVRVTSNHIQINDSLSVKEFSRADTDVTTSSVPLWLKIAFAAVVAGAILTSIGIRFRR